ncbi:uncharacterized protein LOC135468382 [Liolophura sinensis]|uniref:uncharacterized protein LOC135468382 n=1 Tax=Liolophura sinensis TaxID=3198878 RepID=UPI003158E31A
MTKNSLDLAKTPKKTGNLLPLIKEELKCKIQAKRLAAGQEELDIHESKPKVNQLTEDDIRRRETRKAQNRRAAQRYRVKQRRLITTDKQEKQRLRVGECVSARPGFVSCKKTSRGY